MGKLIWFYTFSLRLSLLINNSDLRRNSSYLNYINGDITLKKNLFAFSIIFLGLCMVLSSWFISQSLKTNRNDETKLSQQEQNSNRCEYIQVSGNYYIIFDRQTGNYWGNLNGEWKETKLPISSQAK